MGNRILIVARGVLAVLAVTGGAPAFAGGYDTGERDWDFLFSQDAVAVESEARFISPWRRLTNITGVFGPSVDVDETEAFTLPRFSLSARLTDQARCMASYREPWGGHANYGAGWTYAASAVEQHFSSRDFGLTCSIHTHLGMGQLHALGGISRQEISYELIQSFAPSVPASTNVGDTGVGWRIGVAYEIPDYALRASVIYNSATRYNMAGSFSAFGASTPIFGQITMPQSAEIKVQSGVAPGWLVFGSVRWTDWSVAQNMPLCPIGLPACSQAFAVSGLALGFRDSWTVTVGAAHPFSDSLAVSASLTWDQGASEGFTSQTDTWVAALNAVLTPGKNVQVDFGGSVGLLTGGTLSTLTLPGGFPNPVGYTASFGDDLVYSLRAAAKLSF